MSAIYYGKEKRDAGELGVADIDRVLLHDYHNPWEARRPVGARDACLSSCGARRADGAIIGHVRSPSRPPARRRDDRCRAARRSALAPPSRGEGVTRSRARCVTTCHDATRCVMMQHGTFCACGVSSRHPTRSRL